MRAAGHSVCVSLASDYPASGQNVIETIKVRRDFLRVRGGFRASVPACLIEAKQRAAKPDTDEPAAALPPRARFGFTVTKKLGNAVRRNRIRRRLKAAIDACAVELGLPGFDYVVVARPAAFDMPFAEMLAQVRRALRRVREQAAKAGAK